MSSYTVLWIEYKEETYWKGIERHETFSTSIPVVLAKIVKSQGRGDVAVLSWNEIFVRLPDDLSREVLEEVRQLPTPSRSIFVEVGWLSLSELVLFDWNAVYRTYPLYQDTYADVIGDWFLDEIVGNPLQRYAEPDRVRLIFWGAD